MTSSSLPQRSRRPRTQFWLAAVIFLGPFIAAFIVYHWFPERLPTGRTNYGRLVDPPLPLPVVAFENAAGKPVGNAGLRGKWRLVYLGSTTCEENCRTRLHFGRQLWLALNEKRVSLQRVYIAPDAATLAAVRSTLAAEQPDLEWFATGADAAPTLKKFFAASQPDALYLLDPPGNWIMTYEPTIGDDAQQRDFKGMQKDLKKLLKL